MLSDCQIERYSRQIVLPEIGGRGQELLLASEVAIHGGDDAAIFCASHLVGAGVGALTLDGVERGSELGRVLGLETRNDDCRWLAEPREPAVVIAIGERLPSRFPATATLLWGAGCDAEARMARLPPGRACVACLAEVARGFGRQDAAPQLLGTVLALEALRVLLNIDRSDRAMLVRIDLDRHQWSSLPFPARPGCDTCR